MNKALYREIFNSVVDKPVRHLIVYETPDDLNRLLFLTGCHGELKPVMELERDSGSLLSRIDHCLLLKIILNSTEDELVNGIVSDSSGRLILKTHLLRLALICGLYLRFGKLVDLKEIQSFEVPENKTEEIIEGAGSLFSILKKDQTRSWVCEFFSDSSIHYLKMPRTRQLFSNYDFVVKESLLLHEKALIPLVEVGSSVFRSNKQLEEKMEKMTFLFNRKILFSVTFIVLTNIMIFVLTTWK
jgi:hypothetical protein